MRPIELVLDTNIVSYQFRGDSLGRRYSEMIHGRQPGITWLTLAEIHYGCALQHWGENRRRQYDAFLSEYPVFPGAHGIARLCGEIRAQRRRRGKPIELADAWMAATALWFEIPLVTHDRDHELIPGLQVITLHDAWRVRDPGTPYHFAPGRAEIPLQ